MSMSSGWLSKLAQLLPLRLWLQVRHKKETITHRIRLETDTFPECHVHEVRRERPFWRADKVDMVHKEPGGEVSYTPLK